MTYIALLQKENVCFAIFYAAHLVVYYNFFISVTTNFSMFLSNAFPSDISNYLIAFDTVSVIFSSAK